MPIDGKDNNGNIANPSNLPNPNHASGFPTRGSTCKAFAIPSTQQGQVILQPAFGNTKLYGAIAMVQIKSNPNKWYVATQKGVVLWLPQQAQVSEQEQVVALDLSKEIYNTNEAGLLGMAADPNGTALYLFYTMPGTIGNFKVESQVVRYPILANNKLDSNTRTILWRMHSPYDFHLGGDLHFGADGLLYIGVGMGSTENDPSRFAQNLRSWRGKILRIDTRQLNPNEPFYTIPPTNPFVSTPGALPEIFALGLRNPWRWSIDGTTNTLWLGDVGANAAEEINVIQAGGNYGFPFKEGSSCNTDGGATAQDCANPALRDPIVSYDHTQGRCIVGGFVYRGQAMASLFGRYLYADCLSGNIWSIPSLISGPQPKPTLLLRAESGILSFGQSSTGELTVLTRTGSAMTLQATNNDPNTFNTVPTTLKQTQCMQGPFLNQPVPGVLPYQINAPFWSDGADKSRFFALPEQGNILLDSNQQLLLPIGTVLIKQFYTDAEPYPFETRLWIRHTSETWRGYSYRWDENLQDARLVDAGGETHTLSQGLVWNFPSQSGCQSCHNGNERSALGWEVSQLNKTITFQDKQSGNQLQAFQAYGLLDGVGPSSTPWAEPFADPISSNQPLEARARAYLHVNCSACHRPGGSATGGLDFSINNPRWLEQLCNQPAVNGTFDLPGGLLLKPGQPEASILTYRMAATNGARMPAISSGIKDEQGLTLIQSWIQTISACPKP